MNKVIFSEDDLIDPNTNQQVDPFRAYQIKRPQISKEYRTLINETIHPDFHSHPAKYGHTFTPHSSAVSSHLGATAAVLGAFNINILNITLARIDEDNGYVNISFEFKAKVPGPEHTYTSRWIKHVATIKETDYLYHEDEWTATLVDQVLNARERLQCPYFWDSLTNFERGE